MKIRLAFSGENGDALSGVLGNICLETKSGCITDDSVYIESWLEVLIDGLRSVKKGQNFLGDLVEEPEPMIFSWDDDGLRIAYGSQEIFLESPEELKAALRDAAEDFSKRFIDNHQKLEGSPIFKKIFGFAERLSCIPE